MTDLRIAPGHAARAAGYKTPYAGKWHLSLRAEAKDGLDPWGFDQIIANGGFKIGFGMAPKIAQVMTALILEWQNDIPEGFEVSASF